MELKKRGEFLSDFSAGNSTAVSFRGLSHRDLNKQLLRFTNPARRRWKSTLIAATDARDAEKRARCMRDGVFAEAAPLFRPQDYRECQPVEAPVAILRVLLFRGPGVSAR